MIKHNPRLSLKDRYRLIKRVLKLALDKDSKYINLLWQTPEGDEQVHTFYAEGTSPIEPFLSYMASVAGKSKTLEAMNERAQYYLNKTTVAFTKLHGLPLDDYCYVANPIRKKPNLCLGLEGYITAKDLYNLDVILVNDFSNHMVTLDYNEDSDVVSFISDDVKIETLLGTSEMPYVNKDAYAIITLIDVKYRLYKLTGLNIHP